MFKAPEFRSIEAFAQFLLDDDRTTFLPGEVQKVAERIHRPMAEVAKELKSYGFSVSLNNKVPVVRGVNSNSHDRFTASNGFVGGCGIGNASRQMVTGWQPT